MMASAVAGRWIAPARAPLRRIHQDAAGVRAVNADSENHGCSDLTLSSPSARAACVRAAACGNRVDVGDLGRRLPEQHAIDLLEKTLELLLVGGAQDEHAAALCRRETRVVEIVAIERQQRPPKLRGQPEVLDIGRAPQILFLHHEEHVPAQPLAHEADQARREDWRRSTRAARRCSLRRMTRVPTPVCPSAYADSRAQADQSGSRLFAPRLFTRAAVRLPLQLGHQRVALVHELLARAPAVLRPDGVLAEQRKRDRRIAVRHDRVGQHAGIHLAPAHRLGRASRPDSPPHTT